MTWSNTYVRFDVQKPIVDSGSQNEVPYFHTDTRVIHGSFYIRDIWWAEFHTGSYSVWVDCGLQDIKNLAIECHLTGTGYAENIGELWFSDITYSPQTFTLGGNIHTDFGDISVDGIILPLWRAFITNDFSSSITANSSILVNIRDKEKYGGGFWNIQYSPSLVIYPQNSIDFIVDFSLATHYDMTIVDPSGSETLFSDIVVIPGNISSTLEAPGSTTLIEKFCSQDPLPNMCEGIYPLTATTLQKQGEDLIAGSNEFYRFSFKLRDKYGNRINVGSVKVSYQTKTQSTQFLAGDISNHSAFISSFAGDAVIASGSLSNWLDGTATTTSIPLISQDIHYDIGSIAPTGTDDIRLTSIEYSDSLGIKSNIALAPDWTIPVNFLPPYTANISGGTLPIRIGVPHAFAFQFTKNGTHTIVPTVLWMLSIGDNAFAGFRDFEFPSSIGIPHCIASIQDMAWYRDECNWSSFSGSLLPPSIFSLNPTESDFVFTGTYASINTTPFSEKIEHSVYVTYSWVNALAQPTSILYPWNRGSFWDGEVPVRIKILWLTNDAGEYGNLWGGIWKIKPTFMDHLRKNVAMMSRNRSDYSNAPYTIYKGDVTLTGGSFDAKKSIIVVGGDIRISENISQKDSPLAVIALSSPDGIWGNIFIDQSVTDVHASLIAEKWVQSSGDYQLYIHGSLIASNTFGDATAGTSFHRICPYHVTVPCTLEIAKKYDFAEMRAGFENLQASDKVSHRSLSSRSSEYPDIPMIIEQDSRVSWNPPPGLE
jgi:hypothetical protein